MGKGEYIIQNLTSVLSNLMPDLKALFMKFNQQEGVNIKFDILFTNQLLKLENLTINSNTFVGAGLIHLSKNEDIKSIIKLSFFKINLKSLTIPPEDIGKFSGSSYRLRFVFDKKKLEVTISADQIILTDDEILNNTQLLLNLENSVLVVQDFSGSFQSRGMVSVGR